MPKLVAPILANFDSIILSKTRFFVVDERMVPLTDQESNTGSYMRLLQQITPSFPQYYPIDNSKFVFFYRSFSPIFTISSFRWYHWLLWRGISDLFKINA